jgi:hypothetical protein
LCTMVWPLVPWHGLHPVLSRVTQQVLVPELMHWLRRGLLWAVSRASLMCVTVTGSVGV